ncbi:MAG: hypothetical protein FWG30_06325 [Eubacteriaceae bacterium]|nr:hypothetical protein [Eubacteriaceae bacterium]
MARDVTRSYIAEKIGSEDGSIVTGDTGLSKSTKSCGLKRQYTGTAGQAGAFLSYAQRGMP